MAWYAIIDSRPPIRRSMAYRNIDDLKNAGCVGRIVRMPNTNGWVISNQPLTKSLCNSTAKISGKIARRP